jgi:hypothetical protein
MLWRLDYLRQIKTSFLMILVRMTMTTTMRRRWTTWSPTTLHVHHHDDNTAMTSRCTKSFHALHVDQIGKVWEAALIVALINPFYSLYDAEAYLDWEMTVDNKFNSHLVLEQHCVRQATSEFKNFAIIWWTELSSLRLQPDT